jgi:hypothetical protein
MSPILLPPAQCFVSFQFVLTVSRESILETEASSMLMSIKSARAGGVNLFSTPSSFDEDQMSQPTLAPSRNVLNSRSLFRATHVFPIVVTCVMVLFAQPFAHAQAASEPATATPAPTTAASTAAAAATKADATPSSSTGMTFQFINNTQRALNLKVFSRGESKQVWPGQTRAYSLRPDSAIQQLKIDCADGERVCWGAWATREELGAQIKGDSRDKRTVTSNYGVGPRGMRDSERACHVCKSGAMTPVIQMTSGVESAGAQ